MFVAVNEVVFPPEITIAVTVRFPPPVFVRRTTVGAELVPTVCEANATDVDVKIDNLSVEQAKQVLALAKHLALPRNLA